MTKKYSVILIVVFVLVIISFLTTQLTNDFMPFWAYGRFVSNSKETGLLALLDTWEMKGLLFKTILAIEYKMTSIFDTSFSLMGQMTYKTIGLIPYLFLLAISISLLPDKYLNNRISKKEVFCFCGILLLAVHFCSHFQAEMWGVCLLILSFTLTLRGGLGLQIIGGIVYTLTFYLKSPIPLLGGSLFFGVMLLKKQSFKNTIIDIIPFALTSFLSLILSLLLIKIYLPQELTDILNASHYQHTLFNPINNIITWSLPRLAFHFVLSFIYHPSILIGVFFVVFLSYNFWKKNESKLFIPLIGMWVFPLLYVLLSNNFFEYHYYLCVFCSLLTLLFFLNTDYFAPTKSIKTLCLVFLAVYLFELSSLSPIVMCEKANYTKVWKENKNNKPSYYIGCHLGKGEVLFLDDGTGAFVFDNPSYLRYFYPLPLERVCENSDYAKTDSYREIKAKTMAYEGDFIVLSKWFLNGNNIDILNKIDKEYVKKENIVIPKFSWSLNPFGIVTKSTSLLMVYERRK